MAQKTADIQTSQKDLKQVKEEKKLASPFRTLRLLGENNSVCQQILLSETLI
jgi:hypothetical protein